MSAKAAKKSVDQAKELFAKANECLKQGQPQQAFDHFHQAAQLDPNNAEYWFSMGGVAMQHNNPSLGFQSFVKALKIDPQNTRYLAFTAHCCRLLRAKEFNQTIKDTLTILLQGENINANSLGNIWLDILGKDPKLAPAISITKSNELDAHEEAFKDPFLLLALKRMIIANPKLESYWTKLRRILLEHSIDNPSSDSHFELKRAFAHQCFLNEYVFSLTEKEEKYAEELRQSIEDGKHDKSDLVTLAMYKHLASLSNAQDIAEKYKKSDISSIVDQQIKAPLEEKEIARRFADQSGIEDKTSLSVQDMYEENPYPRWEDVPVVAAADIPELEYLVAGCGTGRNTYELGKAIPQSKVTAIDLSRTSLAYAIRKVKELNADNIEFKHMDLLKVKDLGKSFDVINCGGVLHHMKDPMQGWKALCEVMNKGGVMSIALYSKLARRHVIEAQKLVKEWGFSTSAEDIRAYRQKIFQLPTDHPAYPVTNKLDFYSTSICRDLCFHVQETCYDWLEIKAMIDELGLELFRVSALPQHVYNNFSSMFPDDPKMTNLENWHKFEQENPDTFVGMFQFWCKRKGESTEDNVAVDKFLKANIS